MSPEMQRAKLAKLFPERKISSHLFDYWRQRDVRDVNRFEHLNIPGDLGGQRRLLQLLTGADQGIDGRARFISRQTFYLLNSMVG